MPRGATSKRAQSARNRKNENTVVPEPTTTTNGDNPVTTSTVEETEMRTDLPFEIQITPAEEGFKPDRSPAGRKRIPSPFETILPGLKGQGWQNQPHDGAVIPENQAEIDAAEEAGTDVPTPKYNTTSSVKDSNARVILRELAKAVKYLNTPDGGKLNLGLDVNVTDALVQFNVRDKQNRKPRTAPGGGEVSDGEDNEDSNSDADNGDE